MLVVIRCFTCGKPIGDKYGEYNSLLSQGREAAQALDELGLERYCCRRMFLGQADLTDEIKKYQRF